MKCTTANQFCEDAVPLSYFIGYSRGDTGSSQVFSSSLFPLCVFAQVVVDVLPRMCAPVMVELEGETDPLLIAMKELK